VLSEQLLSSVALQRLELAEHEATVRSAREVVQAIGGVPAARHHGNPFIREQANLFADSAAHLARHRRFQAEWGLCPAPKHRTKKIRNAKRARDAAIARANLAQRKAAHEQALTEQRLLEGSKLYYDPTKDKSGNRTFGRAPDEPSSPDREYVVAYASRSLTPAESNYAPTEGECLALVWATRKFRQFSHGQHFAVRTGHAALKWLATARFEHSKLERWALRLQEFDFEVEYLPCEQNVVADHLSRHFPHMRAGAASAVAGHPLRIPWLARCWTYRPLEVTSVTRLHGVRRSYSGTGVPATRTPSRVHPALFVVKLKVTLALLSVTPASVPSIYSA
jgi:hypothetical protein